MPCVNVVRIISGAKKALPIAVQSASNAATTTTTTSSAYWIRRIRWARRRGLSFRLAGAVVVSVMQVPTYCLTSGSVPNHFL
jgi:hypothetical protein